MGRRFGGGRFARGRADAAGLQGLDCGVLMLPQVLADGERRELMREWWSRFIVSCCSRATWVLGVRQGRDGQAVADALHSVAGDCRTPEVPVGRLMDITRRKRRLNKEAPPPGCLVSHPSGRRGNPSQ
ncbi:hypothetical protein GCM10010507_60640 [Streptomyces cinnamoneus]|uniref:Uncharacterized protein n=1 Tax=Streptomyces cinnamoneus TaxID=53446 RepID=A0A918U059_STRCJ|nr:hypothetical protein GCM10010507_60640 [Streptomyces cinnamoneus]